jgi:hypothetical protein
MTAGPKESDHAFGLLKRLNQCVEQDPIEAAVREPNVIVMVLVEGVHAVLQGGERPRRIEHGHFYELKTCARSAPHSQGLRPWPISRDTGISRAEPLAILYQAGLDGSN